MKIRAKTTMYIIFMFSIPENKILRERASINMRIVTFFLIDKIILVRENIKIVITVKGSIISSF